MAVFSLPDVIHVCHAGFASGWQPDSSLCFLGNHQRGSFVLVAYKTKFEKHAAVRLKHF